MFRSKKENKLTPIEMIEKIMVALNMNQNVERTMMKMIVEQQIVAEDLQKQINELKRLN